MKRVSAALQKVALSLMEHRGLFDIKVVIVSFSCVDVPSYILLGNCCCHNSVWVERRFVMLVMLEFSTLISDLLYQFSLSFRNGLLHLSLI